MDKASARKAGEIFAELLVSGEPIDFRDASIAGIALENESTLVTRNKAHFSRIKALKLQTWQLRNVV